MLASLWSGEWWIWEMSNTVVTPASPVGQALVGRCAGDDFELVARGAMREWVIGSID